MFPPSNKLCFANNKHNILRIFLPEEITRIAKITHVTFVYRACFFVLNTPRYYINSPNIYVAIVYLLISFMLCITEAGLRVLK